MDKNKEESVKRQYRVRNWAEYNRALVNRGDLTLWISEEVAEGWYNQEKTGRKGSSDIYSDLAVECGLTFREMYKIRLGMTQGFLNGLFKDCKAPDYTTLCKRGKRLEIRIPRSRMSGKRTVVVDSTGLKVYGEGEWKVKKHGTDGKRRTWRKLHLAVDAGNLEVVGMELTSNEVGDGEVLPDLLAQLPHGVDVDKVAADGAYDTRDCHDAILKAGADALIPPREGAVEWKKLPDGSAIF